jgi:hypothetical protein
VLRQVLLALACIHEQRIVHCDLKGDNILIASDGSARISDFEMSKDLATASASTLIGGTLGFIAPEVQSRQAKPSTASDMYSFGVIALNALHVPPAADYPRTDSSIATDHPWIALLMAQSPAKRLSAVKLQANPYFQAGLQDVPTYWSEKHVQAAPSRVSCADLQIGRHDVYNLMRHSIHDGHNNGCGKGTSLQNFRVTRLERVENMALWANYQHQKTGLRRRVHHFGYSPEQLHPTAYISDHRILDAEINEYWLWHGTKPDTAEILATSGFDERVAKLTGLYGAGSYFADAMCKANQYATDVNAAGEHCMLYCRVTMGAAFKTTGSHQGLRRPEENSATPGAPYDSIFAEKGVAHEGRQTHNEFIIFRHDQVYPEYIIWYKC